MNTSSSVAAGPGRRVGRLVTQVGLVVLFLLLIGSMGFLVFVADILTRPPRFPLAGDPLRMVGLAYKDITFPARGDGVPIAAWFLPNADSTQVVIFVHGKGQNRSTEFANRSLELAKALHTHGFNVLMLDLRGHGESGDARFTFAIRERRDVLGAVDWLQAQGFAPGSIGVIGVSMGAASSIGATAEEPAIGALVSDSAYAEFFPIVERAFVAESGLPQFLLPPTIFAANVLIGEDMAQARPVADIGAIALRPVLLIHARGDELIPVEHAYQLAEAYPDAELWVMDAQEHAKTFHADPQAYVARVAGFFAEHLC